MQVKPRLWRQLWSWFKSINGMHFVPHSSGASPRRSRRFARASRLQRSFSFERCEPRQLLASDIGLAEFGATGTHLVVSYDIAEETAPAFNVSVYRSSNGVTRDALVSPRNSCKTFSESTEGFMDEHVLDPDGDGNDNDPGDEIYLMTARETDLNTDIIFEDKTRKHLNLTDKETVERAPPAS
jgi:hypothetical protein